jgi:hypothetical protein
LTFREGATSCQQVRHTQHTDTRPTRADGVRRKDGGWNGRRTGRVLAAEPGGCRSGCRWDNHRGWFYDVARRRHPSGCHVDNYESHSYRCRGYGTHYPLPPTFDPPSLLPCTSLICSHSLPRPSSSPEILTFPARTIPLPTVHITLIPFHSRTIYLGLESFTLALTPHPSQYPIRPPSPAFSSALTSPNHSLTRRYPEP